jgi:hypothetical protein
MKTNTRLARRQQLLSTPPTSSHFSSSLMAVTCHQAYALQQLAKSNWFNSHLMALTHLLVVAARWHDEPSKQLIDDDDVGDKFCPVVLLQALSGV